MILVLLWTIADLMITLVILTVVLGITIARPWYDAVLRVCRMPCHVSLVSRR